MSDTYEIEIDSSEFLFSEPIRASSVEWDGPPIAYNLERRRDPEFLLAISGLVTAGGILVMTILAVVVTLRG